MKETNEYTFLRTKSHTYSLCGTVKKQSLGTLRNYENYEANWHNFCRTYQTAWEVN